MKGVRIYIEGGGNSSDEKAELRRGFSVFLKELKDAVTAKRLRWDVILSGGRQATFDSYKDALQDHPDSLNILLVDAEAPVTSTPWQHLAARDHWQNPGVGDDYCHLMVQTVEAWLIADPDTLESYYGQGFRRNLLSRNNNVEAVPKQDLEPKLKQASEYTKKGEYKKIQHCAELLAKIDVAKVRSRTPHCDRLFTTVMSFL